jgi:translation initiation factor 4G
MSNQEDLEPKTETEVVTEQAAACEVATPEATEVSETEQNTEAVTTESLEQTQAQLEEKDRVIAEMQIKLEEAEAAMKKKMKEEEEMKKKLQDTEAAMKKMEDEVKNMKQKELMAKRKASLIECGFDSNDIQESIAAYTSLDDTAFEAVVAVMKKKMAKMVKDEEKKMVKAENEFETTEEILEEVQETEALDLTVGGEDSEPNTTSAALIDFVYSRLGKKLNKGE